MNFYTKSVPFMRALFQGAKMKVKALKLLFLVIALACFVAVSSATNYYVSYKNGLDSNPGTLAQPWKTIGKVNVMMAFFNPGDSILFKRGETWNEQLWIKKGGSAAGGYLTFGVYGTGNKPVFWTNAAVTPPIQCTTEGISYVHIDGIHTYAPKSNPRTHNNGIYIYPDGGTHWWISNVEVSQADQNGIIMAGVETYLIEDSVFHNARGKCIFIAGTATNSITNGTIRNCKAYNSMEEGIIGFHALKWGYTSPPVGPNHLVENCEFFGSPETGIDLANAQYVTFRHCYIHDNVLGSIATGPGPGYGNFTFDRCYFKESTWGASFQTDVLYGGTNHITFTNNIMYYTGINTALKIGGNDYSIYNNTFYLTKGKFIDFYPDYPSFNIKVKNNIFYYAG